MPFADSFPVRAMGPRTDLSFAYVHADIGASGAPTIDEAKTTAGFSITRSGTGTYSLTFPKCRFCLPIGDVRPDDTADETDARKVNVAKDLDPTSGAVTFTTQEYVDVTADTSTIADPVSGSEIVFIVLLGF